MSTTVEWMRTKTSSERDKPHLIQNREARWPGVLYWPWNQRDSDVCEVVCFATLIILKYTYKGSGQF